MKRIVPRNFVSIPSEAERVFKGQIYDVYQWEQERYDGTIATYEMLKRPGTVNVLAIVDDKLLLLDQEQPNVGKFYDIPGGRDDEEGETELQAAQRETLEETGYTFKNWRLLSAVQPHTKVDQIVYLFLAWDVINKTGQNLDSGELIEVRKVTIEEMIELSDDPLARYLPKEMLEQYGSVERLKTAPEFEGIEAGS